jgi:predicted SnoaL-like aldol condensation-catalyzing enzyme
MTTKRKQLIHALLKGIETGDPTSVEVVNQDQYIQHNPHTHEGGEGLAALFKRLSETNPKVNIVRLFSDGDFVFGQTEYDFSSQRVGFEVFRFEGEQTVEHWDNIQSRMGPNASGHSMVDGETKVSELDKTEANREIIRGFVTDVLISKQFGLLEKIVSDRIVEHSPHSCDGVEALFETLTAKQETGETVVRYKKLHKLLAEGNFVLAMCEGYKVDMHTAFYDLFRLDESKIVEHWGTIESIASRDEWKNDNGKY